MDADAAQRYKDKTGKEIGGFTRFNESMEYQGDVFKAARYKFYGSLDQAGYDQEVRDAQKRYLERMYGKDIAGDIMKNPVNVQAGAETMDKAVKGFDEALKNIAAQADDLNHPKAPKFFAEDPDEKEHVTRGSGKMSPHLTELQRVGAYAANAPLLDVNKKMERHLADINRKMDHGQRFGGVKF